MSIILRHNLLPVLLLGREASFCRPCYLRQALYEVREHLDGLDGGEFVCLGGRQVILVEDVHLRAVYRDDVEDMLLVDRRGATCLCLLAP